MALSYSQDNCGVALVRRPQGGTSTDWVHVSWVNGERDVYVDAPGSGSWEYGLILVIGAANLADGGSITASGRQTIVATNIKR